MKKLEIDELKYNLSNFFSENDVSRIEYEIMKILEKRKKEISTVVKKTENLELIRHFAINKKIAGCTDRTVAYYNNSLIHFEKEVQKNLLEIQADDIKMFLVTKQFRDRISNTGLDNLRRVLSSFYAWLHKEDFIIKNPMLKISKIKSPYKQQPIFTTREITLMTEALKTNREKALFHFLISTGARVGEITVLRKENVNFENNTALVLGKGNKERIIYFNSSTAYYLQEYAKIRDLQAPNAEYFFLSELSPFGRLRISGIEVWVRNLGKKVGVSANPHKFRRTFATNALRKGIKIEEIQRILGHEKLETTLFYAKLDNDDVRYTYGRKME